MSPHDDKFLRRTRPPEVEPRDLGRLARDVLGRRSDVDDVAQDVWLLYQREPPGRVRSVVAWFRVAILRVAVRARQRDRQRAQRERMVAREDLAPSVVEQLEHQLDREFLAALVDGLSEPYREVVRLRYMEELEVEEIAERLQRAPGTIRSQLKRGLDLLRVRCRGEPRRGWLTALLPWRWRRTAARRGAPATPLAGTFSVLALGVVALALVALVSTSLFVAFPRERESPLSSVRAAEVEQDLRLALPASAIPSAGRTALFPASRVQPLPAAELPAENAWATEVRGRVLTPDGSPVPHAAILVGREDESGSRVIGHSDERGEFRIAGVDRRLVTWAEHPERAPSGRRFIGSVATGREIDLCLGHEVGTLTGRVLSHQGRPVAGAEVVSIGFQKFYSSAKSDALSLGAPRVRVRTEVDGSFRLGHPVTEKVSVLVTAEGHAPLAAEFVGLADTRGMVLRLPGPCILEGRLLRPDGTPVPGARVGLLFPEPLPAVETTTDSHGGFRFDALPAGPHVLRLLTDLDGPSCHLQDALAEGQHAFRTVTLAEEQTIRGLVLDGESPLAGWEVELEDRNRDLQAFPRELRRTRTSADGRFAFPSCSLSDTHVIRLFEPGATDGTPCAVALDVRPEREALVLRPRAADSRPGSLVGSFASGDPGPRPTIAVLCGRALTEPLLLAVDPRTGAFAAERLAPAEYSLRAWIPGKGVWKAGLPVIRAGRRTELFAPVPEPGRLVVRVDLPEGSNLADVSAPLITPAFHDLDDEAHSANLIRRPEESSLFCELFPGAYTYSVRHRGVLLETRHATIESGRTTTELVPLREGVPVLLRLSFARALGRGEMISLLVREKHGGERSFGLVPPLCGTSRRFRVLLTPDTEELLVRTGEGLRGRLAVTAADIVPGAELRLDLVQSASD